MTVSLIQHLVIWSFVSLLAWAAISDTLHLIIPNRVSLGLVLLYPAQVLIAGPGIDTLLAIAVAAVVLLAAAGLFARGWLGGGDVKLMAATALWAGPKFAGDFLLVMTLSGAVLAVVLLTPMAALWPIYLSPEPAANGGARRLRRNMPYGVAIAIGGFYVAMHLIAP